MNGAMAILKALKDNGVDTIFGYPGGAVLPIYDAIYQQNSIRHILVRHEQAALHAAEGYARSTGKVGVALVTSGPGATNAVTGLTDALLDSIPIVCLTGQVPNQLIGTDAFQEADTIGITRSCTKANYLIKDEKQLVNAVFEAFYVAKTGRPGPVVIDVPKDVQFANVEYKKITNFKHKSYNPQTNADMDKIKQAVKLIINAKKPVIYGGGGIINSGKNACKLLTELVNLTNAPTTLTLMGLGALDGNHKNFLGMLGLHGTIEANMAMHDCDVMIAIGARFDDRVTGVPHLFSPNSKKIHIDIDESSINKIINIDVGILGDCHSVLKDIIKELKSEKFSPDKTNLKKWWEQIDKWKMKKCLQYKTSKKTIVPQHAVKRLYEITKDLKKKVLVTTEVGQHQMWAAQYFKQARPNRWMTSGGLGTMGYGFPSAIGAQVAFPDALTICIAGDASIQMNIQEMATATQYNLPVKVFVLNNRWMGMVRQWQELLHEQRYSSTYCESLPDFVALAKAYGWHGIRISKMSELDDKIKEMIEYDGPVFVDCEVEKLENIFPMIPSGAAHNEMIQATSANAISDDGKKLV